MSILIKYLFAFCLITSVYSQSIAQKNSPLIAEIKTYVQYIDSINNIDYTQDIGYMKSIADGVIKNNDKIIGGIGIYSLLNIKGDTAYRIEYHDNVNINIYKIYYYKSDELIYAVTELKDYKLNRQTIFRKEEFYNKGIIIYTTTKQVKNAKKYSYKTNFSMYEDGMEYLNKFNNKNRF